MRLVFLGLSITSSWGNGHATTYRALLKALAGRGHEIVFLERAAPWYAAHRDLPRPRFCTLHLYDDVTELQRRHAGLVARADAVILGSYVQDGVTVGGWACDTAEGLTAFYDIDTPVTLAKLGRGDHEYLSPALLRRFDLYLSFTGGPILRRLEREYGARRALPLYCSVDPQAYYPMAVPERWAMGYLGTYSADRQPKLERLLLEPARLLPEERLALAGAAYPDIAWPENLERIPHLPPPEHPAFYAAQRFTLNLTRADMVAAGHSPSVRLFEAAACGVPVISDAWEGLDALFRPGREILLAETTEDVLRILRDCGPARGREIGQAARAVVLRRHTADRRARELEAALAETARACRDHGRPAPGRQAAGPAPGRQAAAGEASP
jgi:spore maturation protein CgeB